MKKRIVVVGNGMVGHKFIDNLVNHADADQYQVITFSEEPRLAYDRVQLSKYFSGSTADDLMLTSTDYYNEKGVQFILSDKVIDLDFDNKEIITASGRRESYDKLILATGSFPFVPPIPGNNGDHCLVYRTIEDLERITASAQQSKIGVVVGGGLLGLEAAAALKAAGLETHVVEFAPRLMAVQLDEGGGKLLRRKIEAIGVRVHTQKATNDIVAGTESRYRMNFADGSHLETDMILFSAGIRPQDELARKCGIGLGERGGIVVDNNCQTTVKDVYAIGECALWNNRIYGLVAPGYQMAKVALSHITGGSDQFMGADMSTKLKLLGVDVASVGDAHGNTPGALSYTYSNDVEEVYKRIIVSADNKKLLGAVLVGDVEAYGTLQSMCVNGLDLPEDPNCLILPNVEGGGAAIGVDALPESACVCSCYDVSKGAICCAVQGGARTMGDIKAITKASTGCGGCSALAKQVMDSELKKLGVEVSNHICEH
ncbi:MAG TPA: nitrite reductase large subunit NirB, partial [Cellvibrio sp.]